MSSLVKLLQLLGIYEKRCEKAIKIKSDYLPHGHGHGTVNEDQNKLQDFLPSTAVIFTETLIIFSGWHGNFD